MIVLDCAAPDIDPLDAAHALASVDAPTVVVWGAPWSTKEKLARSAECAKWIHVGIDTEPATLADLLRSLI